MKARSELLLAGLLGAACLLGFPARAQSQAPAAPAPATAESVRKDVETDKRGLVERYMHLTPEEAKRFGPIYEEYQRKLAPIRQRQNRAVLDYVHSEESMTDANARRIAKDLLETDADEQRLRERTHKAMLAVLPGKKAVRYLQIENKIRAINRYDMAERMPLVK